MTNQQQANGHQNISASLEDYLEAILHIVKDKNAARAKDIVERLQVKGSSVTGALKLLSEKGLVNYTPYDQITLTPEGEALAQDVARRHQVLHDFFSRILCVDEEEAEEAACKLEHAIPRRILDRLIQFTAFLDTCPKTQNKWREAFHSFCEKGAPQTDNCLNCMTESQARLQEIKNKT